MERASQNLMHEHDAILFSLKVLGEICNMVELRKDVLIKDITDLNLSGLYSPKLASFLGS